MRPQEPSVPPYRTTGPGGAIRPDHGGRAPSHARPDDGEPRYDDPYGDVPAPPPTEDGGMHAPYGASGWSGSDRYEPTPTITPGAYGGDPLDGGRPGGPVSGSAGNGSPPWGGSGMSGPHGPSAPAGPAHGPGPYGAGPPPVGPNGAGRNGFGPGPQGPGSTPRRSARPGEGPARGGPPWGAAPAPMPFGVPRPDGGAPGFEPARPGVPPTPPAHGTNGTSRPPASPPVGTPPPAPRPSAGEQATSSAASSPSAPAPASADDGGLAGADGFASRPRASRDAATTTGTTGTTRTGGAGVGPGRHRRAGTGPGRDDVDEPEGAVDVEDAEGSEESEDTGRAGRRAAKSGKGGKKAKRKGSFWRELPLLIVVAVVLTFVIQTFLARIYVIPSASMERTLHGCNGCANDRVAVDKVTYRFSEPSPGDVVVFRGPPAWGDNGEVSNSQRSDNVLVRGLQSGLSLVGLAPPDEKDFVKRVIAVGGQTVACCDPQNRVTVDGQPLNEPYLYFQPNLGRTQADFPPVRVPDGQLWVMGDNRNNSADARVHGPIGITDVIGKARVIVLPVGRWGGVPDTDPQAQPSALGAPAWQSAAPLAAGVVGAVPLVVLSRRWRRSLHGAADRPVPAEGGPAPPPSRGDPDR